MAKTLLNRSPLNDGTEPVTCKDCGFYHCECPTFNKAMEKIVFRKSDNTPISSLYKIQQNVNIRLNN